MMEQLLPSGGSFTLIHFVASINPEKIACMPNMKEFHYTDYHMNYQRTNAAAAVTCPACKKTDAYRAAKGK